MSEDKKKKIVFVSTNPQDMASIRFDREHSKILTELQGSQFQLETFLAAQPKDLQNALSQYSPQIFHFSGHGNKQGLIFEDSKGKAQLFSSERLDELFQIFGQHQLECIVLNACYSEEQALLIAQHIDYIDYVVGIDGKIGDDAAIEFSLGFYRNLANGKSYEEAYYLGCHNMKVAGFPQDAYRPIFWKRCDVFQNLPMKITNFIDRDAEIEKLKQFLEHDNHKPIVVSGFGGVGKSELVLQIAHKCLEASKYRRYPPHMPVFDAIIWTSVQPSELTLAVQPSELTLEGTVTHQPRQEFLDQIVQAIRQTLGDIGITEAPLEEQNNRICSILDRQPTLLILENLEAIQENEKDNVTRFLNTLASTTTNVQVVITTRELYLALNNIQPLHLQGLEEKNSKQLIVQQAEEKQINLDEKTKNQVHNHSQGLPFAIIYAIGQLAIVDAIGQLANYETLKSIFPSDNNQKRDCPPQVNPLICYCLEKSGESLKNKFSKAYEVLLSLALFRNPIEKEAVAKVAGLEHFPHDLDQHLARLQLFSLISQRGTKYRMHPLTHWYAMSELSKDRQFEQEVRERWVQYYLNFAHKHGGKDQGDWWDTQYSYLEKEWENLLAVLKWCADKERFDDVKNLWQDLNDYASIYGYWQIRLYWTDWLIKHSIQRLDWSTAIYAMSSKGWTLTQMFKLEEAEKLLLAARELAKDQGFELQDSLAKHFVYLHLRKQDNQKKPNYTKTYSELKKHQTIVNKLCKRMKLYTAQVSGTQLEQGNDLIKQIQLEHKQRISRSQINMNYYKVEILFFEEKYDDAIKKLQEVIKECKLINWLRREVYAQHWLGIIAIQKNNLEEAEKYLENGLSVVLKNNEIRYTAYYQRTLAVLYKAQGKPVEACSKAKEAIQGFKKLLGMDKDIQEILTHFPELAEMGVE